MSNDERVNELNKRIKTTLMQSNTLPNKKKIKPNTAKLKRLAREIRKHITEDYDREASLYPHIGSRS